MKINVKYGLLCFVAIILVACGAVGRKPQGMYSLQNDTHYFAIKDDSTFTYKYVIDTFVDIVSEGKWRMKDPNTILLNSYQPPYHIPLIFERKKTATSNRVRQVYVELISDMKNENEFYCIPFTNRESLPSYTKKRGSQMIETAFLIDSISFKIFKEPKENSRPKPRLYYEKQSIPPRYTSVETEQIALQLKPGESAYLTINITDSMFSYRVFQNTPISLESNGISFFDTDDQKRYHLKAH